MTERRLREDALAIWKAGVAAVEAGRLVHDTVRLGGGSLYFEREAKRVALPLADFERIAVVGAGKATAAMARALEEALGAILLEHKRVRGWVNVPDATVALLPPASRPAVHVHGARKLPDNRPTAEGVEGSKKILEIVRSLGKDDLLIVLLSGGGSALLPLPVEGVTLDEKLRVTALLQEHGATIGEMNCVRKHLSQIKGGRLAQATKARVVTLIISDVIGDPLDVIASGPTAADPTNFAEAWRALERHALLLSVPASVRDHLRAGRDGRVEETPKLLSDRVTNIVIGNNETARRAAMDRATSLGYAEIDLGIVEGDTQFAALDMADEIREAQGKSGRSICLIDGGETTVKLSPGHGKGGRNQEFALAVLNELGADGLAGVCLLCGGTDGEDGPTDAAGAIVDEELARAAIAKGLDPADFLRRHDAYHFFEALGGLVKTGPTNTNVMDLRVTLIDRREGAAVPALRQPEVKSASARGIASRQA